MEEVRVRRHQRSQRSGALRYTRRSPLEEDRTGEQTVVRQINHEEVREIAEYFADKYDLEFWDEVVNVDNAYIAVLPEYMTDAPGYTGPVFLVVFGSGPEFTFTFVRNRTSGRLEPVTIEDVNPPGHSGIAGIER